MIENNELKYSIKAKNDAVSLSAANHIRDHIFEATGKNIAVVTVNDDEVVNSDEYTIFVGCINIASRAGVTLTADTSKGTYLLKSHINNVFLLANNEDGYLLGAHKFLEKTLGYDHYGRDTYSYDLIADNVDIPYLNEQHTTAFEHRRCDDTDFTWHDGDELNYNSGNWNNKNPLVPVDNGQRYHNSTLIIKPSEYKNSHPSWFSLNSSGNLATDPYIQLCYTARGNTSEYNALVNLTANKIIDIFANTSDLSKNTLCFGMGDSISHCCCSACKSASDSYGGSNAGTVVKFLNDVYSIISGRITETNRDEVFLNFLAYYDYEKAPVGISCSSHVGVIIAPIQANYTEAINSDINYEQYGSLFSSWAPVCSRIDTWLYETNFQYYLYPLNSFKATTESIRYLASLGSVNTVYTQGQHNINAPRTGFTSLKKYLNSKFMDDPTSNYDELVNKFFANYYGEGGSEMKTFFDEMVSRLEYDEANYVSVLYANNRKTVGQKIDDARLWDFNQLKSWVNLCEVAINKTSSETLKKHILAESIFPRFALCTLFSNKYSSSDLLALRSAFKSDCELLGIDKYKEADCSLKTDYFDTWGL